MWVSVISRPPDDEQVVMHGLRMFLAPLTHERKIKECKGCARGLGMYPVWHDWLSYSANNGYHSGIHSPLMGAEGSFILHLAGTVDEPVPLTYGLYFELDERGRTPVISESTFRGPRGERLLDSRSAGRHD